MERWYPPVLLLQLDAGPGTRPRSVYQLLASGKLRIVEERTTVSRQKRGAASNGLAALRNHSPVLGMTWPVLVFTWALGPAGT